jgi:hypothetical protein
MSNDGIRRRTEYRKAALVNGLLIEEMIRDSKVRVFSLDIGLDWEIQTHSDPFKLTELILMGVQFADDDGDGDHVSILNLWTCADDINDPSDHGRPDLPRYVHWGSDRDHQPPKILLHSWLPEEMKKLCETDEQRQLLHQLTGVIKKLRRQGLLDCRVRRTSK